MTTGERGSTKALHLRSLLIVLLWTSTYGLSSLSSLSSSPAPVSTCRYRTINYLLDSLPQQCPTAVHFPSSATVTEPDPNPVLSSTTPSSTLETESSTVHSSDSGNLTTVSTTIADSQFEAPSKNSVVAVDTPGSEEGFLSFEDWKRLNRLRSAERVDAGEGIIQPQQAREAPQPRYDYKDQSVDSIGDDLDIQVGSSAYGKTSKERFNYASFDCAAAVLKSNPEAKGSSAILDENRDRYMLNKCAASSKFVIIEMCEDILVDTVVLANFEFFSSTFKEFRISVTDRYPINERGWKTIGTYTGNNTRTLQVFAVKNPLIWARYIRIEFLSHYGSEFYCPLSLLRIHGTTMMEEYKNQENLPQHEYTNAQDVVSSRALKTTTSSEGKSAEPLQSATTAASNEMVGSVHGDSLPTSDILHPKHEPPVEGTIDNAGLTDLGLQAQATLPNVSLHHSIIEKTSLNLTNPLNSQLDVETDRCKSQELNSTASSFEAKNNEVGPVGTIDSILSASGKTESPASVPTSVNPTTQESVYKTITKRLSLLEANATLSLRYIEEQSQLLRDVFGKMERRHGQKMDSFLLDMNTTLSAQLQYFRQQYEQLWQSTIVELESQRDESREEILALSSRLSLLADELIFQKRMSIAHSIMLLITLVFVLTTRGIALDLNTGAMRGLRGDHLSPVSSPPLKRSGSLLFGQSFRPTSEKLETPTDKLKKSGVIMQQFDTLGDSVQSAPATPAGVLQAWRTRSDSASVEHDPPLPEEYCLQDNGSTDNDESSGRGTAAETDHQFLNMRNEGQMDGNRYLTPLSILGD